MKMEKAEAKKSEQAAVNNGIFWAPPICVNLINTIATG
jgi:hypothetical protein